MKAAWEINPELAAASLPNSYVLATKKMEDDMWFMHQATSASLAELASSSFPRLAPRGASFFLCPCGRGLTTHAVGGSWWQMSGSLQHLLLTGFFTKEAAPYGRACFHPGFPQCELVHSRSAFRQQQRNQNIGLCGCQYHTCQNFLLVGLKAPDGGGTVWFCFLKSCEVRDTEVGGPAPKIVI